MTELAHLAGKVALVTGGASGIGLGMASAFAAAGMTLVLADIDEGQLATAAEGLRAGGARVITARLDVRDRAAWAELVARIDAELGGVWLLCNNAGVSAFDKLAEMPAQAWDWLLGINLGGVFNGVHAVVPGMIARGTGHVVNTGSLGGLAVVPGTPIGAYYVAKAGVIALSEKLREEVADHGVGVSVLCPGPVESRLQATSAGTRPGSPDEREPNDYRAGEQGVLSARAVGDLVVRGVLENSPYILPHPQARPMVERRFAALLAAFDGAAARTQS